MSTLSNSLTKLTLSAKKASFVNELQESKIFLRELENHTEESRIKNGFTIDLLRQFMYSNLKWNTQTIDNDAMSIWETHMRREGDYSEYCGTNKKLCVFVTTNTLLVRTALEFKNNNPSIPSIQQWNHNRLPIISDVRLTCRIWSPATQSMGISVLKLAANAVAACQPTQRYIRKMQETIETLQNTVPEFAQISVPEFFNDEITESILEKTDGNEDNLSIEMLATTINEVAELRAFKHQEHTKQMNELFLQENKKFRVLESKTIDSAIQKYKERLAGDKLLLHSILNWDLVVTGVFALFGGVVRLHWNSNASTSILIAATAISIIETRFLSNSTKVALLTSAIPKVKQRFSKRVLKNLSAAELDYSNIIVRRAIQETALISRCETFLNRNL